MYGVYGIAFISVCLAGWALMLYVIRPVRLTKAIAAGWREQSGRITKRYVLVWRIRNYLQKSSLEHELQRLLRQESKSKNAV